MPGGVTTIILFSVNKIQKVSDSVTAGSKLWQRWIILTLWLIQVVDQEVDRIFWAFLDDCGHHVLEYIVHFLLFDVGLDLLLELHFDLLDIEALCCFIVLVHWQVQF